MDILFKTLQFLLSLSILVIVHEFGHFAFARLFNTRVEKFYLFFNAWFSLAKCKVVNGKRKWYFFTKNKDVEGENIEKTEYGIGWIPLGGYVKIAGMIDESMDKEQMKLPAQPWEFRSKPAWQRLLIMVGGVLVNFVFAIAIYIGVLYHWGEEYLPNDNVKYGIMVDSLGKQIGLQNGDKIISVSNKKVESFERIIPELILGNPKSIKVLRDNKEIDVIVYDSIMPKILGRESSFLSPRVPFLIGEVIQNSAAEKAGIKSGDKIVKLNNDTILYFDEFRTKIQVYKYPQFFELVKDELLSKFTTEKKLYKNRLIKITVLRNKTLKEFSVTLSAETYIGARPADYDEF
jgi:regulator of sigma E protease